MQINVSQGRSGTSSSTTTTTTTAAAPANVQIPDVVGMTLTQARASPGPDARFQGIPGQQIVRIGPQVRADG